MQGKVKKLTDKGFGFITPDDGSRKDLFFHVSALKGVSFDSLREGDTVEFDMIEGEKGPKAIDVRIVE